MIISHEDLQGFLFSKNEVLKDVFFANVLVCGVLNRCAKLPEGEPDEHD